MFLNRVASLRLTQGVSKDMINVVSAAHASTKAAAKAAAEVRATEVFPDAKPVNSHRYRDALNVNETPVWGDQTAKGSPIKYVISDQKKSYVFTYPIYTVGKDKEMERERES